MLVNSKRAYFLSEWRFRVDNAIIYYIRAISKMYWNPVFLMHLDLFGGTLAAKLSSISWPLSPTFVSKGFRVFSLASAKVPYSKKLTRTTPSCRMSIISALYQQRSSFHCAVQLSPIFQSSTFSSFVTVLWSRFLKGPFNNSSSLISQKEIEAVSPSRVCFTHLDRKYE